jgi:YcxB-like protein
VSGPEPESISFSSSPDASDWASAYLLIIRERWIWRKLCVTVLLIWLFYFLLLVGIDVLDYGWKPRVLVANLMPSAKWAALVSALLILITVLLTPRRVRKVVEDARRLAPETHFEADSVGLKTRNAISTSSLVWSQFDRWLDNSRVLVLIIARNSFFIIRKSELEPGVCDKLRALLVAAEVPTR